MRWLPQIDQGLSFHLNNTLWGFLNSSICCDYVQMAFICHPFQSCSVALWLEADDADQITAGLPAWKGYSHNGLCEVFPLNTLSLFSPLLVFLSLFLEHLWLLDYICAERADWKGDSKDSHPVQLVSYLPEILRLPWLWYISSWQTLTESRFLQIKRRWLVIFFYCIFFFNNLFFYCFPSWTHRQIFRFMMPHVCKVHQSKCKAVNK